MWKRLWNLWAISRIQAVTPRNYGWVVMIWFGRIWSILYFWTWVLLTRKSRQSNTKSLFPTCKTCQKPLICQSGGEEGIRTLEAFRLTRFPSVRTRPAMRPLHLCQVVTGFPGEWFNFYLSTGREFNGKVRERPVQCWQRLFCPGILPDALGLTNRTIHDRIAPA